jgi:aspartate/methionine/tyrosine aminotransferase
MDPSMLSRRSEAIAPFFVMELAKMAIDLEMSGRSIVHLSLGEPDFTAPPLVAEAARHAIEEGRVRYTPALGLPQLRQAISRFYLERYGLQVGAERIVVTAGASAALVLAAAALFDVGDEVLLPDPSYPCNRHILSAAGVDSRLIACPASSRFQLDAAALAAAWGPRTRGALIATPSNPTGTTVDTAVLRELAGAVFDRGGRLVVDEIYQGLTYDAPPATALQIDERIVVINSFSKYFGMTGWRLGWLVAPAAWVPAFERLAQNLYICASSVAQHAALACFGPQCLAVFEDRRLQFRQRRDYLVPELRRLGLDVPAEPDGAFYVYADMHRVARRAGHSVEDSTAFALRMLEQAGVCLVPGKDFGVVNADRFVRLSYATSMPQLQEAVRRLQDSL